MLLLLYMFFFLAIAYLGLILYYHLLWRKVPSENFSLSESAALPIITIIIPARNEAENIAACLDALIAQRYPADKRQIIVVDDHSTDNSAAIVLASSEHNVQLLSLEGYKKEETNSYKKKAISMAMEHATGDIIVGTDADCSMGENWLQSIAANFNEEVTVFLAMPVAYKEGKGFLSIFQQLDFYTLQGITAAVVHNQKQNMCNGANLAYSRAAFDAINGFEGVDDIASGDDMLLMQKIAKHYPDKIKYLKSKEAIVYTDAMPTWEKFLQQRIRWASKADKYKEWQMTAVLVLVYLFNLALFVLPILCIWKNTEVFLGLTLIQLWAIILAVKIIIELIFLLPVLRFFNASKLAFWFPIAQPFHIIYTVLAGGLGAFGSYEWKGRRVR